ncbi:hypothetical protein CYY_006492 [Polysphondylium violaceum]|uniref:Exonuclease domain-containing protein n=1 Tax=Polysphondylium violaceum TaxID=133409 RepID=A0A8J4UY68_9MYCE|nr:hypothetical protein CYY_006492 [Polysphondylium violaceum]
MVSNNNNKQKQAPREGWVYKKKGLKIKKKEKKVVIKPKVDTPPAIVIEQPPQEIIPVPKEAVNSNWNQLNKSLQGKLKVYQKKKEVKLANKAQKEAAESAKAERSIVYIKDYNELFQEESDDKSATKYLAIDCKVLEVEGNKSSIGKICIANQFGNIIYEKVVIPLENVIDYRTKYTGLTRDIINRKGVKFFEVQKEVEKILRDKIIIGHDLNEDLKVLKLTYKKKQLRDALHFPQFFNPTTKEQDSLKNISKRELKFSPDRWEVDGVRDAKLCMLLYLKCKKEWEQFTNQKFYGKDITKAFA